MSWRSPHLWSKASNAGASDDDIDRSRSGRNRKIFALRYFLWRRTGEGLDELEALARSMERDEVRSGLTMWVFRNDVAPRAIRNESGRLSPEDPGYRFIEMARPNAPQDNPPSQ